MASIFVLVSISTLLLAAASPSSPPQPVSSPDSSQPGCTDELVAFSPCLDYVSEAPNNQTDMPSSLCCEAFSKSFNSRDGNCFCYLMRQPLIFGFPLNKSRLVSLPTVCASVYATTATMNKASLESICAAESPALPPLRSSTGIPTPKQPGLAADNDSSSDSGTPPIAMPKPTSLSVTIKQIGNNESGFLKEAIALLPIVFLLLADR